MSAGFLNLCPRKPCTRGAKIYRKTNDGQLDIYDFILPFGGHLQEPAEPQFLQTARYPDVRSKA